VTMNRRLMTLPHGGFVHANSTSYEWLVERIQSGSRPKAAEEILLSMEMAAELAEGFHLGRFADAVIKSQHVSLWPRAIILQILFCGTNLVAASCVYHSTWRWAVTLGLCTNSWSTSPDSGRATPIDLLPKRAPSLACDDGADNGGKAGIGFDGSTSENGGEPKPLCVVKLSRLTEATGCRPRRRVRDRTARRHAPSPGMQAVSERNTVRAMMCARREPGATP